MSSYLLWASIATKYNATVKTTPSNIPPRKVSEANPHSTSFGLKVDCIVVVLSKLLLK